MKNNTILIGFLFVISIYAEEPSGSTLTLPPLVRRNAVYYSTPAYDTQGAASSGRFLVPLEEFTQEEDTPTDTEDNH